MNEMVVRLASMPPSAIDVVRRLEDEAKKLPQVEVETEHAFHAGMYARTIMIPAGITLTGALIQIPTILIFSGDALVYTAAGSERMTGYRVILAPMNRKQAFYAVSDTFLTMIFPTSATTVEDAESEFTTEAEQLLSRKQGRS